MNPQATEGGATLLPELNGSREGGALPFMKALRDWAEVTYQAESANSAASSTTHVVAQRGAKQEAALDGRTRNLISSFRGSSSATPGKRASVAVRQQELAVPVKKVAKPKGRLRASSGSSTRWENHDKRTCKCAVCCTCRGELKSSWYKHHQSTCACAVCRQSRREPRAKEAPPTVTGEVGGGGHCTKHSLPTIPGKRASWMPLQLTRTECWACSREFPRYGGGLQQRPSPLSSRPQSTFRSFAAVLNSSSASSPPVRVESCNTTTGIPMSLLQKLNSLAGRGADCSSSVHGISPISRSSLDSAQKCTFEAKHDRLTCEQRFEISCRAENSNAEQQALQTKLLSNSRCSSGWSNPDHTTCSKRFTENSSDGVQQCRNDSFNMQQSCDSLAAMSYYCSAGLSWRNNVDRGQDVAGTLTGLHDADSPLFVETRKLNLPRTLNTREPVKETFSSAFSTFTERNVQDSNSENMIKTGPYAAASLQDPFLSLGQTTSFLGGHPCSVAHKQPTLASQSGIFQEMDYKPVYVRLQCSNSVPHTLSGRSSSVAQFPFGLEVQAQAEHDVYHPVGDLQAQIHARPISLDCDEGNRQSSSPLCETTSTTSMVHDKDNSPHVMDVDSRDTLSSSGDIPQGALERQVLFSGVDAGDPARLGCDKGVRPAKPGGQKFSKRSANPDDHRSTVHQKRTRREGVSHPVPKWCQLIHPKYDHPTIIWKMCRSRVPKKFQSPSRALEPSSVKSKENGNSGDLSAEGNIVEGRSRLEESMASNGLQSRDSTGAREFTTIKAARRDAFVVPEEHIALRESSQESPSRKKCFASPEAEVKVNLMGKTIGKSNVYRTIPERFGLQDTAPVVQCDDDSNDESEARGREIFRSLKESMSLPCGQDISMTDISHIARKARRTTIYAINGHLRKAVQLTDSPIQNVLAEAGIGCPGRKRSRTELKTCSERIQSRLDPSRLLIPQLEDTCLSQPLKKNNKGQRHHGVSVGTSLPCNNVKSLSKVDPARGANSNGQIMKLTVEVVLPESTKVYYLTRLSKVWTPELTVCVTELVKDMTHQSPSTLMVHSHLVPNQNTSLCSTPHMLLEAFKSFLCQKTTRSVTWSNLGRGMSIHCPSNIGEVKENSIENRILGTRSRQDEELSSFWRVHGTRNGFLRLPHDRLTVYTEDLISDEVCDRMIKGSASISSGMRSQCLSSFLCDSAPNAVDDWAILGGTKSQRRGMTHVDQPQQSLTHEVQLTPLRNIVFPYWIDKPLHGWIHVAFPCIILKWSPPRLRLCGDSGDQCMTSSEENQVAERHCELVPTRCCLSDNMEDDLNIEERHHRGQIFNDGVISEAGVLLPVNAVKSMEHEESPGSSEFHGDFTNVTETRPLHTPCGSSFQDLLKSVLQGDNIVSSPLQNNSESKTDLKEELHQIGSNECPRSISGLDFWDCLSDPRNDDGPASATASCSSDSLSKPIRRRGCPKGGWPKKSTDKKNLYFSAANKDTVDGHGTTSQHVADAEADFEVVQSTNNRISNRRNSEFKKKLESFLDRPFQLQELNDLEEHACLRKPLLRHRETRQRVLLVATAKDGMSYLDYHPDLARKVADAGTPEERLSLLRGFFFWIQHSCASGSYKPWAPNVDEAEDSDEDCVEIFPQEKNENHLYTVASTTKATVESRPVKCEQTRAVNEMHMTLRTRGQKRKSASQTNKSTYLWKQMKPSVESRVKRERK